MSSFYGSSVKKKFNQGYENKIIQFSAFLLNHSSMYFESKASEYLRRKIFFFLHIQFVEHKLFYVQLVH
jgi:hypothetical protein